MTELPLVHGTNFLILPPSPNNRSGTLLWPASPISFSPIEDSSKSGGIFTEKLHFRMSFL